MPREVEFLVEVSKKAKFCIWVGQEQRETIRRDKGEKNTGHWINSLGPFINKNKASLVPRAKAK